MIARHFSLPEHCGRTFAISIIFTEWGKIVTSLTVAWETSENNKTTDIDNNNETGFILVCINVNEPLYT